MSHDQNAPARPKVNVDLPEAIAPGIYSNFAVIAHSPIEFVVDFAQLLPGMQQASIRSRILLAPHHAKQLLNLLADNIQRFERAHGPIRELGAAPGTDGRALPLTFSGPQGEA
jgi:hypothetical protein